MKIFIQTEIWIVLVICLIFFGAGRGYALEPDEILIIANSDVKESVQIAQYYCAKRAVPKKNILALPLGTSLDDSISRGDYEKKLAEPIRDKLYSPKFAGRIRCLLTIYGVPIKVGKRAPLKERQEELKQLQGLLEQEKVKLEHLKQYNTSKSAKQEKKLSQRIKQLRFDIAPIIGSETNASVDSELSMVLFGDYQLYRWQSNKLRQFAPHWDFKSLMVCRLDGPDFKIAKKLIDKAMSAEKVGLKGSAYIDSRGIADDGKSYSYGFYDQSLRDLAAMTRVWTDLSVTQEQTGELFGLGSCPQTALYCGWYSLKNYVDAFEFVDGAIGYHISSWEAIDLRDPNSSQWCPAMLKD
ncbi:MAG: TIGR03790 family protein, partial [Planctomycetes bacterium]|nr:TIGR03790 family protein [Planctomycetota bacterium]